VIGSVRLASREGEENESGPKQPIVSTGPRGI